VTAAIVGADLLDRLFVAEFPPDEGADLVKELRAEVIAARQAAFAALMLRVATGGDGDLVQVAEDALDRFLGASREQRLAVAADPAFSIWLQRAARLEGGDKVGVARMVADFPAVFARCLERLDRDDFGLVKPVELVRYSVDPLVAEVAPPTYTFPPAEEAQELEAKTPYSLEIFKEIARAALRRVGLAWPELLELFPHYVRTIVHLPYAEFRSASASRYAGVIFLTADDHSVLEVEESLVHEWAHQLLYSVMERDPIVVDGSRDDLTLPWSGARRDFYGYFHALFVYTLLLRYLERIAGRDELELQRVRELYLHILRGAVRALPDFADDARFTAHGLRLRQLLQAAVETRAAAWPNLMEGDSDDSDGRGSHD
jgi:hypothetical protein